MVETLLVHPLLRREGARLGKALALGLAIQLLAVGVLVPALATDGSTLPASLELPDPAPGDQATYTVAGPGTQLDHIVATWHAPAWTMGPDGQPVLTRALNLTFVGPVPPGEHPVFGYDGRPDTIAHERSVETHVDASDAEPILWTRSVRETQALDAYGNDDLRVNRTERYVARQTHYTDARLPVGFLTDLHHAPVPTSEPVAVLGTDPRSGPFTLHAEGVEQVQGIQTVRYAAQPAGVRVWYAPDLPFPVAVHAPANLLLAGNASSAVLDLTLVGFEPGDDVALDPGTRPDALGPVETIPRRAWGPAPDGFSAPLPAQEAYRALQAERGPGSVNAFRSTHPDAYVAEADLHEREPPPEPRPEPDPDERLGLLARGQDDPTWVWRFYVTDGEQGIERFVIREPSALDGKGHDLEVRSREQMAHDAYPLPAEHHPPADAAPATLPTLGGLEAHHATLLEDPPPDRWALRISCSDAPCQDVEATVELVGVRTEARHQERTARSQVETVQDAYASLAVDHRGHIVHLDQQTWTSDEGYTTSIQRASSDPQAPSAEPWTGGQMTWAPSAAETGLMAVLAGAIYYLWPKLKTLGLALYSRIGKDDVLDNETRAQILELVRQDPGIHFSELRERLQAGAGQLDHHLDRLVSNDVLSEVSTPGYRCYFEKGRTDPRLMDAADRLRSDTARALLEQLGDGRAPNVTSLCEAIGLSRSGAQYHLDRLEEAGLIEREQAGRAIAPSLTDLGRQALDLITREDRAERAPCGDPP